MEAKCGKMPFFYLKIIIKKLINVKVSSYNKMSNRKVVALFIMDFP